MRLETSARYVFATSHMQEGWDATGLLQPLWQRVGGRDALAELTGIGGGTLSGYNTGRLRLGLRNGYKIAEALAVSILDLGAPEQQADEPGAQPGADRNGRLLGSPPTAASRNHERTLPAVNDQG